MKTPQIEHGVLDPNTGAEITTPLGIPDYWVGKRVQIPAWSDRWMMGDRYGEIVSGRSWSGRRYKRCKPAPRNIGPEKLYKVKLDKSGVSVKFYADDLILID